MDLETEVFAMILSNLKTNANFWTLLLYPSDQSQVDTFRKMKLSEKTINRSSHPEVFCKKSVPRYFAKFTGIHWLRPATFLKKRLWHRCFSVTFAKFLRTPFLTEHFRCLLLTVVTIDLLNHFDLTIPTFNQTSTWHQYIVNHTWPMNG